MPNPIGFSDLFSYNNREEVLAAIRDLKELKVNYADFIQTVTGAALDRFTAQQKQMTDQITQMSAATKELSVTNQQHQQVLLDSMKAIEGNRAATEGATKAKKGAKIVEETLAGSVDGLTKELLAQIKAYRAIDQSVEANIEKANSASAGIRGLKEQIRDLNSKMSITKATFQAAEGSYNALDAVTRKLIADFKALGDVEGANKDKAAALQTQIKANTEQLKKYDATLGQNFRSVGNYKTAFDGLSLQVSQVMREVPAAAISLNTFFLAISNNLPMLADEMRRVTAANKAAKLESIAAAAAAREQAVATALAGGASKETAIALGAQAEAQALSNAQTNAAPSLMKRLIGSLFSFNSLITLGVIALTFFGARIVNWIEGLFTGKKAVDEFAASMKILNEVMNSAFSKAGEHIANLKLLYNAATTTANGIDQQVRAAERLQSTYPNTFANFSKEQIMAGLSAEAYKELTKAILESAKAEAGRASLAGLETQRLQAEAQKVKIAAATTREIAAVKPISGKNFLGETVVSKESIEERRQYDIKVITERRAKATQVEDDKLKSIAAQENAILNVIGKQTLLREGQIGDLDAAQKSLTGYQKKLGELKAEYGGLDTAAADYTKRTATLIPQIKDLELKIKALQDAISIKPGPKGKDPDKELERALRKQDETLQAQAKLEVAEAEHRFALSAKTVDDELKFEKERRDINVHYSELRKKLWSTDTDYWKKAEKDKVDAQTVFENQRIKILEADITRRQQMALRSAQADFNSITPQESQLGIRKSTAAEVEYQGKIRDINIGAAQERLQLYQKDSDEYNKALDDKYNAEVNYQKKVFDLLQEAGAARHKMDVAQLQLSRAESNSGLKVKVVKGQAAPEDLERQIHMQRITDTNDEIVMYQKKLAFMKDGDADFYNTQKAIADLQKELVDENANYEIAAYERVKAKRMEMIMAVVDFVTTSEQALFDLGRDINAQRIKDLEERRDKEIEIAGNNSKAKKKIEENYQKEIDKLKRKQAIADKISSLFNIAINTAVGVMKTVATLGYPAATPFVALTILQGAIQAAAVAAKPLPAFKGKKKGEKEGLYEINEQGFELVERDGKMFVEGQGGRTVTYLQKEDIVHTHERSKKIIEEGIYNKEVDTWVDGLLQNTKVVRQVEDSKLNRMATLIAEGQLSEYQIEKIAESIFKRIPLNNFVVDEKGYREFTLKMGTRIENVNSRNSMFGNH